MTTTRVRLGALALVLVAALTGCVPEPAGDAGPSASEPGTASPSASPSSSPTPTTEAADITLPADCPSIYSADLLATLEQQNPPLNDPGVTMLSTQNALFLETLDTVPTLRCSWGPPGEAGLSTNVSIVDPAQAQAIEAELANAGYGCAEESDATICRIEQRGVSLDDAEYTRGEIHALRGNAWVATAWLNFSPEGYTESILTTLWG